MRKLKKTRLIWLIVISLVLGLFFPALLMAEVREESEDLSLYRIEGTTDETYLRDHLMTLLDTIEDQGYELREDVQEEFHTLSLGWLGSTADDMRHTQSVIISDSPYEHDLPFRDRSLLLHYTSSTVGGEDALTTLLEEMATALDLDVRGLEPPDPDFEETSRGSYPLGDTDSSIHYLFIKSESLCKRIRHVLQIDLKKRSYSV